MDRTVASVVTGAASGVGLAVATSLIDAGRTVIGVDRAWGDAEVDGLTTVSGSVGERSTWTEVLDVADKVGATVDQLVINAAQLRVGGVLDISEEDFDSTMNVNVAGAFLALRACLPGMVRKGAGTVVAVASVDALFAEQDLAAYCTSKGALLQLMRSVAVDYGRAGIRANSVCPGAIDTPFFRQHVDAAEDPAAFLEGKVQRHPSGRILEPSDVASAVLYLLSESARGINGTQLVVDGGLTATFDFQAK